jgi:hypothetical protein
MVYAQAVNKEGHSLRTLGDGLGVVLSILYIPDGVKTEAKETLRYFDDLSAWSAREADGIYGLTASAFAGLYRL